jgi:hypothetical protein
MVKEVENLSDREQDAMMKAPLLVCILIAGADNNIDQHEVKSAIHLANAALAKSGVSEIFKAAAEDFEDKFKIVLQGLPPDAAQRNPVLVEELSALNAILPKLTKVFAQEYYKCLLFIAKRIAEASGGVLGIKSIGEEEMKWMKLPMIKDPATL